LWLKGFIKVFVEQKEEQLPQRANSSPQWYRNVALIFFVMAAVLTWAAITRHDWLYGAFAIITTLNAILTTLKFITVRETGR
jgi:hypothetical protein